MKRSPGPTPCSPLIDQQDDVGVGELALDPALHPLGEHVARPLHPGQVDEDQLPAGRRRRWRCRGSPAASSAAASETIATWLPTIALTRVDLPTLGRPARPMKPERRHRQRPSIDLGPAAPASRRRRSRGRSRRGGARRGRPPRSTSVQCSGQITTSPSSRGPAAGPTPSTGKASTSVGASLPRCSRLSSRIRSASTSSTARWPSPTPAAASAALDRARAAPPGTSERSRRQERGVGPCSARAARSRLPCAS